MKVLIISYYWPPSGGSGVQRWMYFSKYLGEFGIEPTVITVKENQASYSSLDESLSKEVQHVRVFKTSTLEPIRLYSFLKSGNTKKSIPQGNVGGKKPGMMDKMARFIRANYFIPDARIGWNPYAFKKAKQLLQQEKFDWVITTGPPHSTHLVGFKLKKELGVNWLADFRDPWTEVYYNDLFKRTKKKEAKDAQLELDVLTFADKIVTVGPSMQTLLQEKLTTGKGKVSYIFNGFDKTKFDKAVKQEFKEFTIAYIGTLSSNYPYLTFIEALKCYINENPSQQIKLLFAGKIEEDVLLDFETLKSNFVELDVRGIISHTEALSLMKSANLLFMCLPMIENASIFVSGKLLEYLASEQPILGILDPKSDAAFLIENYSNGKVFRQEDISKIAVFIDEVQRNQIQMSRYKISDFERKETTKKLACFLVEKKKML
jgi:glycosyltransferase involved in cell wall biosynthesis